MFGLNIPNLNSFIFHNWASNVKYILSEKYLSSILNQVEKAPEKDVNGTNIAEVEAFAIR